jgi:hypothetical protein
MMSVMAARSLGNVRLSGRTLRRATRFPNYSAEMIGDPQHTMPKAVTEIRSLARSHTRTALKLLIFDKVLGLGSTDGLTGFASTTANLIVASYFAKRGFENVARILKR